MFPIYCEGVGHRVYRDDSGLQGLYVQSNLLKAGYIIYRRLYGDII